MKTLIFFISLISFSCFAYSQINFPGPDENPFWTEYHGSLWSCDCGCGGSYYCTSIDPVYYSGETTIGPYTYFILVKRGVCSASFAGTPIPGCPASCSWLESESVYANIRIDSAENKVYYYDGFQDTLLYDFSALAVGNPYPKTYTNTLGDSLVVVSVDSVLLGTQYAKKWNLGIHQAGQIADSAFVSIIEGIGSTYGHLSLLIPPFENADALQCFSRNDSVLYPDTAAACDKSLGFNMKERDVHVSIYPNPCTDFLMIETDQQGMIRILDAAGCIVIDDQLSNKPVSVSSLSAGVYFVEFIWNNGHSVRIFNKN